jgi:hypothetical protein
VKDSSRFVIEWKCNEGSISHLKEFAHVYSVFTFSTVCDGGIDQQFRPAIRSANFGIIWRAWRADLLPQACLLLFDQSQMLLQILDH